MAGRERRKCPRANSPSPQSGQPPAKRPVGRQCSTQWAGRLAPPRPSSRATQGAPAAAAAPSGGQSPHRAPAFV
eukprot:7981797-Alexandrium_andersonii.AAC.1